MSCAPSVTVFCRYFRVASLAQAHKVIIIVCSAAGQRNDVVNLLGGCKLTFLQTHLTKRMICNVPVTDSFPCSSVSLTHCRVTVIFFIPFILLLLMLILLLCMLTFFLSFYHSMSIILFIATIEFSCVPNAVNLKYPSPDGPNPLPGVPTTFAFSNNLSKNSHDFILFGVFNQI